MRSDGKTRCISTSRSCRILSGSDEHKTKPTQHSVKELQGMGIAPNIIVLRCDEPLEDNIFKKIALFCNVKEDCVIENLHRPGAV